MYVYIYIYIYIYIHSYFDVEQKRNKKEEKIIITNKQIKNITSTSRWSMGTRTPSSSACRAAPRIGIYIYIYTKIIIQIKN